MHQVFKRRLLLALFSLLPAMPLIASESTPATPKIEAETLDGTGFSVDAAHGSVLLVSVWSPESLSSRKCIAELQRFADNYASRGVRVFAASALDDKKALQAFMTERKPTLPVGILKEHSLGRLDDLRMPYVYVFDREGKLRTAHTGLFSLRVLEGLVAPLLP